MPLAPLVFSAKTRDLAVEADLVDAVVGRLAEEQLPLVVDRRAVGGAVALAHELPLLAGDQRLEDVLLRRPRGWP